MAKIFLPSFDCRTKALCKNIGKDFPAIIGLMNGKDFPAILGLTNKKLYVETLAKIFLPSLDCRMAKIFLPSLDWRTKVLCGNFGKDFPAILGLTNKSTMWEHWQRFSCHPWTDKGKLYVGTLAKILVPSLDWQTKALRGNFGKDFPAILRLSSGKDFPAILGLSNKSSMLEHWQRFSCHPWTDEQNLYVGTLAKIFLPSLDWRTKALRGNFGKDFPANLGLTNKKLYVETLAKIFLPSLDCWMAKIFLPSLDCRRKALCGNIGKDFPAILRL